MELKNPADENATIKSAYNQIQTYKQAIPSLFNYNEILIISDGLEARAGSLSAGFDRFMAWKSVDGKREASNLMGQFEVLIKGLLNKNTLLDSIRFFVVFDKSKKEDEKGQATVTITKKIAAYHQYYAVNKAIKSTLRTANNSKGNNLLKESPASYGLPDVKTQPEGDRKAGVVWHTQGVRKIPFYVVLYS
ncbi:Type I restriction enzyme R protein N terminus (HSDR_N) [Desulfurobacterium atlanticum]|uniref:type I site-specific deoxyribonuclease n=1 Tax=Desulfurobacterium atlanticum TaxID=240169 RepID=A0A239A0B8_9BACT|nr:type I restriction endonuclease [Desulfurobacterium atlanticum]SNR89087.1 Type I restriction enzyme R protein N terminus (HSDR_N) [Desulfurobacterium atlanticum]